MEKVLHAMDLSLIRMDFLRVVFSEGDQFDPPKSTPPPHPPLIFSKQLN